MNDVIIVGKMLDMELPKGYDYIGCDLGAILLMQQGIKMELAIGDFDSTDTIDGLDQFAKEIIKLNTHKDYSDLYEAVMWALPKYKHLYVYGALQGRQDHQWSNLSLITQYDYPITFINQNNKIYRLNDGKHLINKDGYKYLSFFPLKKGVISIEGVKYPLTQREINPQDLYLLSNEILEDKAIVNIEGSVLVMQTNDNKKHQ